MNDSENDKADRNGLKRYVWVLVATWTVIIVGSTLWNINQIKENTLEAALVSARASFLWDLAYRQWSTIHGGVYVPVTEETPPNPYLNVPERDITTPSGIILTLLNPSYMTRQVHELAEKDYGIFGNITSLNPINPQNTADPWEVDALWAFELGESEVSSIEQIAGQDYMRLMTPLVTENYCLKCHAEQGYQVGDIRGGISISIPMAPLWAIDERQKLLLTTGHSLLWLVGIIGIVLGTRRLRQSEFERTLAKEALIRKAKELARSNDELVAVNKELEAFSYSVSHDLSAPLRSLDGFSQAMLEDYNDKVDEQGKDFLGRIRAASQRMGQLIDDLLELSRITRIEMHRETVDLTALAQTIAKELQEREPQRRVEFVIAQGAVADGDSRLLRVALDNLLGNAWKFTAKRPDARIEFGITRHKGGTAYFVRDNGAGFDMTYADKLFDAFQRLHKPTEFPGIGIGLATVQRVIRRHGGSIWAEGAVGKGATFFFTLQL